jgi:fructokinase
MANFGKSAALLSSSGIGLVNLISTMVGLILIDRVGRKKLMIVGSAGLVLMLGMVSYSFYSQSFAGVPYYLFGFIGFFAFSQGSVIWVFISEIFPNEARDVGQSFGSFTHWILAALVANIFPSVAEIFGAGPIFLFFTVLMVFQLAFSWFVMPETKGLSFEDIQAKLSRRKGLFSPDLPTLNNHKNNFNAVCFGEVLWDMLPAGPVVGGAPLNVAYHLNALGIRTSIISKIGEDTLGSDLLEFIEKSQISVDHIGKDSTLPTSVVNVSLNHKGSPTYDILPNVAWDNIQPSPEITKLVSQSDLLIFGSLACRSSVTKTTLSSLFANAKKKVLDVNLRLDFYSRELVELLLVNADIIKMNDEELEIIANWHGYEGDLTHKMRLLFEAYEPEVLLVTMGRKGACWVDANQTFFQEGFKVEVQDTVGSGDAFLAGLLSRYLVGDTPSECLAFACATGAYVTGKTGGTPAISTAIIQKFINEQALVF